jgi:hypothetical protein
MGPNRLINRSIISQGAYSSGAATDAGAFLVSDQVLGGAIPDPMLLTLRPALTCRAATRGPGSARPIPWG